MNIISLKIFCLPALLCLPFTVAKFGSAVLEGICSSTSSGKTSFLLQLTFHTTRSERVELITLTFDELKDY